MNYRGRIATALLGAASLIAGCEGCNGGAGLDVQNGIDPVGNTPATLSSASSEPWVSRWDNPVVGSSITLYEDQTASRAEAAWQWTLFDLTVTLGAEVHRPWPAAPGVVTPATGELFWELHGIRLAPRILGIENEGIMTLQAYRDDWNKPAQAVNNPGRFQLDKRVILVPLNVVVTYPIDDPVTPADPNRIPLHDVEILLDDHWTLEDATTHTTPDAFPKDVTASWKRVPPLNMVQPDRVWDQCDIQFRLVQFKACPVPKDIYHNSAVTGPGQCSADLQAKKVDQAIAPCLTLNGASTVVFLGTLTNECGEELGAASKNNTHIYIEEGAYNLVLAHELGHRLGLLDTGGENGVCGAKTLMCTYASNQARELLGCESTAPDCGACVAARKQALALQGAYNGW